MNIGIIIHSHSGNTLAVGEKILNTLKTADHAAEVKRVVAENENPSPLGPVVLKENPDTDPYDAVIFGAPVWAFSLSPVMQTYLKQVKGIQGVQASIFVTQFFPFPWMGGHRAIRQMKALCERAGFRVVKTGIVNWSRKNRGMRIDQVLQQMSAL